MNQTVGHHHLVCDKMASRQRQLAQVESDQLGEVRIFAW